ncbi:MAG TPA: toll/interleukin-1 receptor domain-containing protein [Candidatus Angelobacter sp.]|nr:toll/interleukin-1 receptor domain-containing protein [Candidatus Angelobacter sp.]
MRLFISHAVADKDLVDAVITLLEMGAGIRTEDIFCTSFDEQGIPPGADFSPYMRERLKEAEVILAIVTPQYYECPFCLCETGGAWATEKKFLPLLVEPVGYDDLRGALYGKQGLLITESGKLDTLRDQLSTLSKGKTTRWNRKKEDFLKALPALLRTMKPVATLSSVDANKLRAELATAKAEAEELDKQNEGLQRHIAELEQAKDAAAVKKIRKKFSTEDKEFDELVKVAKSAIGKLPRVVREAMLFHVRSDYFNPQYEEWGNDVSDAIQRNFLKDDESVSLNDDHPIVERALEAFSKLTDFEEEATSGFRKSYRKEFSEDLDATSRTFWEDHELL